MEEKIRFHSLAGFDESRDSYGSCIYSLGEEPAMPVLVEQNVLRVVSRPTSAKWIYRTNIPQMIQRMVYPPRDDEWRELFSEQEKWLHEHEPNVCEMEALLHIHDAMLEEEDDIANCTISNLTQIPGLEYSYHVRAALLQILWSFVDPTIRKEEMDIHTLVQRCVMLGKVLWKLVSVGSEPIALNQQSLLPRLILYLWWLYPKQECLQLFLIERISNGDMISQSLGILVGSYLQMAREESTLYQEPSLLLKQRVQQIIDLCKSLPCENSHCIRFLEHIPIQKKE